MGVTQNRTWTDEQLRRAVGTSTSWRGVLRALGLSATSAGAIRTVRRHAIRLRLDVSHFRGRRSWSDAELRNAVAAAESWDDVLKTLGLSTMSGNARTHIKGHATRLGIDFRHLGSREVVAATPPQIAPDLAHLREAGPSIAAAWFAMRGCDVLFPIEPAVYDLVVSMPDGLRRVQVKTTTSRNSVGWQVGISRHPHSLEKGGPRLPYDPDDIDYFFVVDGDMTMHLIPSRVVAGRVALGLQTYRAYVVGNASGLLGTSASADAARATAVVSQSA
jgi:PD-(D/E)XK endonuclease